MAILQSKASELRYLKRKQLEEESRVLGNYYRDCIRQFGIDCTYYKRDTTEFTNFKGIIDQNAILRKAYGYNSTPDYTMSVDMVTFPEIDADIFSLNKYGLVPQTDVTFIFDSTQFACDLAPKYGQLKEYPIAETEIVCEVPECTDEYEEYPTDIDEETGQPVKHYISASVFPYDLGKGKPYTYTCGILSGYLQAKINGYTVDKESTVICDPYEHTDFKIEFPANSDLYYSMKYKIMNDDYIETMLKLTYTVTKVQTGEYVDRLNISTDQRLDNIHFIKNAFKKILKFLSYDKRYDDIQFNVNSITNISQLLNMMSLFESRFHISQQSTSRLTEIKDRMSAIIDKVTQVEIVRPIEKFILHGKLHGSILFYDITSIGKYLEKIHPMVGDIIEIDFPDDKNREKYEITDCFDKNLGSDGINPLLHKYVWKCKARRYVNSYEDNAPAPTEADLRIEEQHKYDAMVTEEIVKSVSLYPENEDAVYGGYDGVVDTYDKQEIDPNKHYMLEYLDQHTALDIIRFGSGSRLVTNGYDLIFVTSTGKPYSITVQDDDRIVNDAVFEENLRFLKATDTKLVFVDITGKTYVICEDEAVKSEKLEMDINSLYDKTTDVGNINVNGDSFYKFKNSRTVLFGTDTHLYCKLKSNEHVYRII